MRKPWYQQRWAQGLSYIFPIRITGIRSDIHPRVDLVLYQGRLMLNGQTVNYSGGGLYDLFKLFFQKHPIQLHSNQQVLILGFGGGSVANLLRQQGFQGMIVGVEADAGIAQIAQEYFRTAQWGNLEILVEDAVQYMNTTKARFDLIVVDLFVNDTVPHCFQEGSFIRSLREHTAENGLVLYNIMTDNASQKKQADLLKELFRQNFHQVGAEGLLVDGAHNEIIYAR